jgi:hypothetical protein
MSFPTEKVEKGNSRQWDQNGVMKGPEASRTSDESSVSGAEVKTIKATLSGRWVIV